MGPGLYSGEPDPSSWFDEGAGSKPTSLGLGIVRNIFAEGDGDLGLAGEGQTMPVRCMVASDPPGVS